MIVTSPSVLSNGVIQGGSCVSSEDDLVFMGESNTMGSLF